MSAIKTTRLDNGNLLVSIPIKINWRGNGNGRRIVIPNSAVANEGRDTFLKAVARGRRWQQYLDDGTVSGVSDLGQKVGRDPSYVARVIRLAHLAPEIIEAVINGDYFMGLSVNLARKALPELWEDQVRRYMKRS